MSNIGTTTICAVLQPVSGTDAIRAAVDAVQTDKTFQKRGSMAAVVIVDNPFATLWYHPEKRIVHHRIHQFISGKAFRDLLLTGTDVLTKNQATKWLSDDRMNAVLRPEDVEWSHEHWFPQTALAGWKWWAIVQPEKTVGQVTMKNLAATYGQYGITSKAFTDPNDALWWLESQP